MRKIILSILLAGAAASPALAQDHGRWHHDDAQGDRAQAQADHQQPREARQDARSERAAQPQAQVEQRPQPVVEQRTAPQFEQRRQIEAGQQAGGQGRGFGGRRFEDRGNAQAQVQTPQPEQRRTFDGRSGSGWTGGRSNWTGDRQTQSGTWNGGNLRQGERATPNVMRDRNSLYVNDPRRQQSQQADGSRWASGGTWNRDWRNDRRYDWRRYRDQHRSIFRLGVYYDPFGYGYRSFDIGYRLFQGYYGQQYWIDPGLYGLPYPPPGTQWVRYWNDALLVDMYSGEVVDEIRGFFW
jgi:hypothetical protein